MRKLVTDLPRGLYDEGVSDVADRGVRRFHPFSFDFDSTPLSLAEPKDEWEEQVKELHRENRAKQLKRLEDEYGKRHIESVINNAMELGSKSISLLAYHNQLHEQARRAFVAGNYYPALVAACALGERILNHLILDLRDSFKSSEHYKKVYRKDSFDDWPFVVSVLTDWNVLVDGVGAAFLALGELRNRSIHFNPETYKSLREDALAALHRLNDIVAKQFGLFGGQPWYIEGTAGAQFIKRACEADPFVRTYLIPKSGFIGPLYGMEFRPEGYWMHLDYKDYGDVELTDEEFSKQYRERDPMMVVSRESIEKQQPAQGDSR
ncbi:MAG TPA: hypothetical protein VK522_19520 [Pseudolabrys sp.]|nr:hypothetical protein [Pseudolabrys sp.]